MKNNNNLKLVFAFIFLFAEIAVSIFFGSSSGGTRDNSKKYLIINNYVAFDVSRGFNEIDVDSDLIKKTKFNVFLNREYFGSYFLKKEGYKINLFNDDSQKIEYSGEIIANNYDEDMKIANLVASNISVNDIVVANEILKNNGVNSKYSVDSSIFNKFVLDLNNDGTDDYLYELISKYEKSSSDYSFIFTYSNNKYNIISSEVNESKNGFKSSILSCLDVNDDGNLDLILSKSEYSVGKSCFEVYSQKNLKFKRLRGCK